MINGDRIIANWSVIYSLSHCPAGSIIRKLASGRISIVTVSITFVAMLDAEDLAQLALSCLLSTEP